jgi:GAF domain-containing protein
MLGVPMMREARPLGVIVVAWKDAGRTPEDQVRLLQTFANQAAIAIDNVRLFNETKEALERQTATAEILKVISGPTGDVQPVFAAIVKNAIRLVGGFSAVVTRLVDAVVHLEAFTSVNPAGDDLLRRVFPLRVDDTPHIRRAIETMTPVCVEDMWTDKQIRPEAREVAKLRGYRSMVHVPMVRDESVVGLIHVTRVEAGSFSEHHVGLLRTFADQAVIAIENARLFNETKEALERQTATADILKVISGSPTDVAPVFDAILKSAATLCGAEIAAMFSYDGELVRMVATYHWSPEAIEYFSKVYPSPPSMKLISGRTILTKSIVKIADSAADPNYDPTSVITGHWRRMLAVPLLREGRPLGVLVVTWREPGETP